MHVQWNCTYFKAFNLAFQFCWISLVQIWMLENIILVIYFIFSFYPLHKNLDGVGSLITDPPSTSFSSIFGFFEKHDLFSPDFAKKKNRFSEIFDNFFFPVWFSKDVFWFLSWFLIIFIILILIFSRFLVYLFSSSFFYFLQSW